MMTNIAEILRNAPKGLKLWSIIYGDVVFEKVDANDYIYFTHEQKIATKIVEDRCGLHRNGQYHTDNDSGIWPCTLFPSKEHQTWDNWQDVLKF